MQPQDSSQHESQCSPITSAGERELISNPKGLEATAGPGSEMPGLTTEIQNIESVRTEHKEGQDVPAMKGSQLQEMVTEAGV